MLLVEPGREMFIQRQNGSSSVSSDPGERYIRVPEHGVSNSSSYDTSATLLPSPLQPAATAGGCSPVFPSEMTSVKEPSDDKAEPYILLEDCYSGHPDDASCASPVFTAAFDGRSTSTKASRQICFGNQIDSKAGNHFGDSATHKVEYCNEFELGEHDSMFVISNSCHSSNVSNYDDDDDVFDYCHYKYPTVCYMSEPDEPNDNTASNFHEPYVNYGRMVDLNSECKNEFFQSSRRHAVYRESVLNCPEFPEFSHVQPMSDHLLPVASTDHYNIGSDRWNFYQSRSVINVCQAPSGDGGNAAADADDDSHDYVNVPLFHARAQLCPPAHMLASAGTFTASASNAKY